MWYIQKTDYYLALKKQILTHAKIRIKLEDIMLSEISQSQTEKYCMRYLEESNSWRQNRMPTAKT